MSRLDIKKALEIVAPKKTKGSKQLLIDLTQQPMLWRWLERQASESECSKTSYVKVLIALDLQKRGKKDE